MQSTLDARSTFDAERLRVLRHAFEGTPPSHPTGLGLWLARLLKR